MRMGTETNEQTGRERVRCASRTGGLSPIASFEPVEQCRDAHFAPRMMPAAPGKSRQWSTGTSQDGRCDAAPPHGGFRLILEYCRKQIDAATRK
jgi:hypothetical protein